MKRFVSAAILFSLGAAVATWYFSCSNSSFSMGPDQSLPAVANIIIGISDSTACVAPAGPYAHIYITISGIEARSNAPGAPGDVGLVDLAPQLAAQPVQVDLLGVADDDCRLATLSQGHVPSGVYQRLRIRLLEAAGEWPATHGENHCRKVDTANCVVMANGAILPLSLPPGGSFDIGPGEMPGGQLVIAAGETTQLNISLDGCDSVVSVVSSDTPGRYAFVPTARAAVLDRASSITGRLVDGVTGKPIEGRAIVALERKDENGVDRIIMTAAPGADGGFVLCPVPAGDYDLAVTAVIGKELAYTTTLLLGVPAGAAMGNVSLARAGTVNAAPATVVGQVSLLSGTARGFGRVRVSALAATGSGHSAIRFTVPLPHSIAGTLVVAGPSAIPYSFTVPAVSPRVGLFSPGGTTFSQDTSAPPALTVEAVGCGSTKTTPSPVRVTPGGTASAPILTISTCAPV